jgi:hypothetical protein
MWESILNSAIKKFPAVSGTLNLIALLKRATTLCPTHSQIQSVHYPRGVQIPDIRTPGLLDFIRWSIIFVGPRCGTVFVSLLWRLEFRGGWQIFGKYLYLCITQSPRNNLKSILILFSSLYYFDVLDLMCLINFLFCFQSKVRNIVYF